MTLKSSVRDDALALVFLPAVFMLLTSCGAPEVLCTQYLPTETNKLLITDWCFQYFPNTPLVMLVGGPVEYAASKGAGWRGDCFGDYGMFGSTWNHKKN